MKPSGRRRGARWLSRIALGLLLAVAVVLVLVVATWLFITSPPGERIIQGKVVAASKDTLPGKLEIGGLDLAANRLVLTNVVLRDPEGNLVARVPRLEVTYGMYDLLNGQVDLHRVVLEKPELYLVLDDRGLNLIRAVSKAQEATEQKPSTLTLRVHDLQMSGALVDFQQSTMESVAPHVRVEDLGAKGELTYLGPKQEMRGQIALDGRFSAPRNGPLSLKADLDQRADALGAALTAALAGVKVDATVARAGTEKDELSLQSVAVPAETMRSFLPSWPLIADAMLAGTVSRNGNVAQLDLHAQAASARVAVKGGIDIARLRAEGLTVDANNVDFAELVPNGPPSNLMLSLRASGGGTSLETLDGQVDLSVPKATLENQTMGPIELHASAAKGAFAISELNVQVPGAALTAQGQGTLQEVQLDGKLRASDLALLGRTLGRIATPEGLPLSGAGALSFHLSGPPTHPGISLKGQFGELRYGDKVARGLTVEASLPDVKKPLDVDAKLRASALHLGERRFRDVHALIGTRGRELTADLSARGFAEVALRIAGLVDADKNGIALSEVQLRYPEATWKLQKPTHLAFGNAAELKGQGGFALDELTLESGRQRITVEGSVRGVKLDLRAQLDNLDLARLPRAAVPEDLNLAGELNLKAEATGTTSKPVAAVTVALRAGRIQTFEDLSLDLSAKYERDRIFGELRTLLLNTSMSGNFDVPIAGLRKGTHEPLALDLAIPSTKLERLFAALRMDPGLRGDAAATIHVEGTAADPRVQIVIHGDQVQQGKSPPGDLDLLVASGPDGALTARVDLTTMGSQNFLLLKTPWTAARFLRGPVTGRMFLDEPVSLEAAFRDVPFEVLKAWDLAAADLKGKASLTIEAKGAVRAPTGTIHLAATGVSAGTLQPLDAYATLTASEEDVRITLTALRGPEHLTDLEAKLAASVASLVQDADPESVRLAIDGAVGPLRLSELQALTEVEPPSPGALRPDGILTAHLTANGTLADPHAQFHLNADKLGVGQQSLGKVDLDYAYDAALSKAKVLLTSAKGGQLTLDATARLDLSSPALKKGLDWKSAPIDASLQAKDFDPSFLSNVSQTVREIAGRIDANATATGTLGGPQFRGHLEWRDGRVALMGFGQYRNIHLLLDGTDEMIALSDFTAKSAGGDIQIAARADRKGDRFLLSGGGEFTRFPLIFDDQLRALLSGRFTLTGDATSDLVMIRELAIPEMHVELPEVRRKDLQDLDRPDDILLVRKGEPLYARRKKRESAPTPGAAAPSTVAAAGDDAPADPPPGRHYTILVNAPRNIWVRGTDVNAEIGLSDGFRIEYGEEALLFGEVRFLRGRVDVLGRRFDVLKDSQVRFAGPAKLPYINITAQHSNEREQVNVFTTIRGQGKDVTIKVSSTPSLSESEIYTLLATGRRTLKRGSGSSMTGSEAASVVGAYLASQVKSVVASKVPLDVFSIEAGSKGLADASVEAGTYLTDKIYLGSIYRLGANPEKNENTAGFRLEYQITPRWSFETEYGTARSGGADLIWSRDY